MALYEIKLGGQPCLDWRRQIGQAGCDTERSMLFLGIGVVLLLLKYFDVGMVATWEWWQVLIPFGLAALWWAWSDWSGRTKRREMAYLQKRKQARVDQQRAALGTKRRR